MCVSLAAEPAVVVSARLRANPPGRADRRPLIAWFACPNAPLSATVPANDPTFENVWDELVWRGLVHVSTDQDALRALLGGDPITYYCGFDPTAPSLHLGNLVQLLTMRRLQLAGHRPLGLVGGSTGLDRRSAPDGRAHAQHARDRRGVGGLPARAGRALPQLRGRQRRPHGQQPRLDGAAERDRLPARDRQALPRRHDAQEGRRRGPPELRRRASATPSSATRSCRAWTSSSCTGSTTACCRPAAATSGATSPAAPTSSIASRACRSHAIGTPLITNSDGTKFGKSEGNAIWLDPAMCSPYRMYQFWLNTDDADVIERLKVFTFLTRAEIEEYEAPRRRRAVPPRGAEAARARGRRHSCTERMRRPP